MADNAPAIDPSIKYLADNILTAAVLQSVHMRLLLMQLQDYKFGPGDERVVEKCLKEIGQVINQIRGT